MIIKGQARGRARQLAAHLLRVDQNESIRTYECRGTLAQDVEGALVEMEARAKAGRSKSPLYHASISPETAYPLTDSQVRQAVDLLEERLGLHAQPRVIVLHRKKDREHVHVVWSRIAAETGNAVSASWNYRAHEQVSRELEARFGHPSLGGPSNPDRQGTRRTVVDYEFRQAERSRVSIDEVSSELTALWRASASGAAFRRSLKAAGYVLARGDRRVFVVIDRAGGVHSLARRIDGAIAADIRAKLKGVSLNELPSVAEARSTIKTRRAAAVVRRNFSNTAREVSLKGAARQAQPFVVMERFRQGIRDIVAPLVAVPPQVMRLAQVLRSASPKTARTYRSMRAALAAEYASRIAQAFRHLPPHEIDAAIAALRSEREAALKALYLAQSNGTATETRRRTSRRKARGTKPYRLRFRRRMVPK